ncbi:hypothetical protein NDU88_001073 [Pleurodeles waltl]|uniref:Uncharacterized protein n=1 Tax=Pleurodeles waltl TaxID=8319 RepID=A0AAV7UT12_PLEWA|nr:hypothetical protein NDU88_001073 [Pleurodeles waltl]
MLVAAPFSVSPHCPLSSSRSLQGKRRERRCRQFQTRGTYFRVLPPSGAEEGLKTPAEVAGRRQSWVAGISAASPTRGCGSAPSVRPPALGLVVGPPVVHWSFRIAFVLFLPRGPRVPRARSVGRVLEAPHGAVPPLCLLFSPVSVGRPWDRDGAAPPPSRLPPAGQPQALQVSATARLTPGSGAQRPLEHSAAGQILQCGHNEAPAASPGSLQHGAPGLGGHLPSWPGHAPI